MPEPSNPEIEDTSTNLQETLNPTQEFSPFMREFIGRTGAHTVVEVGADSGLQRAAKIAPAVDKYYAVALSNDVQRMLYAPHELGLENVEVLAGNAVTLSEVVPHADIVMFHNVLLDLTGNDTALMWKYRRGEDKASKEDWEKLQRRFGEALVRGYKGALKVATPGYVVSFQRKETADREEMDAFIAQALKISEGKVEKKELFYDGTKDPWVAHIIDNSEETI